MAYSDFTLAKVKEMFDLTLEEDRNLFLNVEPAQPSDYLTNVSPPCSLPSYSIKEPNTKFHQFMEQ